jgi:hypothetical protein
MDQVMDDKKDKLFEICQKVSTAIHEMVIQEVNELMDEGEDEIMSLMPSAMSLTLLEAAVGSFRAADMDEQYVHEIVGQLYAMPRDPEIEH